jgi:hypothetical protein
MDPFRLTHIDTYSNILYVKELQAELSQLAHTVVRIEKYSTEACCVVGNYYSFKGQVRAKTADRRSQTASDESHLDLSSFVSYLLNPPPFSLHHYIDSHYNLHSTLLHIAVVARAGSAVLPARPAIKQQVPIGLDSYGPRVHGAAQHCRGMLCFIFSFRTLLFPICVRSFRLCFTLFDSCGLHITPTTFHTETQAVQCYRLAVEVSDTDYRAWYGLGQTYEMLHLYQYAAYYYKKAAFLRPADARMWGAVGSCLLKMSSGVAVSNAYLT